MCPQMDRVLPTCGDVVRYRKTVEGVDGGGGGERQCRLSFSVTFFYVRGNSICELITRDLAWW